MISETFQSINAGDLSKNRDALLAVFLKSGVFGLAFEVARFINESD